ncbi:MAG: DUF4386 domain-containing protein [Acidimicrobiia bacterium]
MRRELQLVEDRGTWLSYDRRTALIAGLVFLATFVFSIPQLATFDAALNNHRFILGAGSDTGVVIGTFLELINVGVNIATAVIFFPILKRQSERIALGYVADRIFEGVMIAVGLISVMALLTLRWHYEGLPQPGSLLVTGRSLVAIHDATFLLGPAFCAGFGNGILLGYLMYKSGLVPRRMAMIGLVGGPLALVTATAVLFGAWDQTSPIGFFFTLPEIVWEFSLSIYLIFWGFRPSPILALDTPA